MEDLKVLVDLVMNIVLAILVIILVFVCLIFFKKARGMGEIGKLIRIMTIFAIITAIS